MFNNDPLSLFLRQVIENVLYYALIQVPFATENYKSIDKAMRYGYNWQLGPFEIWDLLGFNQVKENLQKDLDHYRTGLIILMAVFMLKSL